MTRLELLYLLIRQSRDNGFDFRKWYTDKLGLPWTDVVEAVKLLSKERRYYALIFSHEFASCFWKSGGALTFVVPNQTFQRTKPDGSVAMVSRKAYTRRTGRADVWRYHLREMAASEDPLRYIRRFLAVASPPSEEQQKKQGAPRLS
jgi:hypothetical protein